MIDDDTHVVWYGRDAEGFCCAFIQESRMRNQSTVKAKAIYHIYIYFLVAT